MSARDDWQIRDHVDEATGEPYRSLVLEESWRLVERYTESWPDDWRLVFRRGDAVVELSVTEEQWRAFDGEAT